MSDAVSLKVPARPEFLHLLRSVLSSVAARQHFSFDEIDDLTIAIDEAGAFLLNLGEDSTMHLAVKVLGGTIDVDLWIELQPDPWPPAGATDGLSWTVLQALTDTVEFARRADFPAIRLTKTRKDTGS